MTSRPAMDSCEFPYVQGNYAPVLDESTLDEGAGGLRVEGRVLQNHSGAFGAPGYSERCCNRTWAPGKGVQTHTSH